MTDRDARSEPSIDARTFQVPLDELTNTLAFKIQREGHNYLPKPPFVAPDIYFLLRLSHRIYQLFFYLNADDRRANDIDWRVAYGAVTLPLIRTMIDCLYNITTILKSPGANGYRFQE